MTLTPPEWLQQRDGTVRPAADSDAWFVLIDAEPQYRLTPVPARGRFTCVIVQTINGKRLDEGTPYATPDEALRGGLEELREALGW